MGTVYRAEQLAIGREVAIKVLRKDFGDDALAEQAAARFTREAKVTSSLVHPNTVRVIDFGSTNTGRLYLVLELLEGEPLADLLEREVMLHPTRVARIGRQIALSLTEAHAQGVVHRDIKPDNIFLCQGAGHTDFVKVVDFGIAGTREAATQSRDRLTSEHAVVGSAHYMSPEQAEGIHVDSRSDLYSLGVVLYEMLTGDPPFDHDSVFKIMVLHATEPPPRIEFSSNMPSSIAQAWRSLVMALLAKGPDDRPATAATIADELEWIREKSAAAGFDVGRLTTSRRSMSDIGAEKPRISRPESVPSLPSVAPGQAVAQAAATSMHDSLGSQLTQMTQRTASPVPSSMETLDTFSGEPVAVGPADEYLPGRNTKLAYWGLAAMAVIIGAIVLWPDAKSDAVASGDAAVSAKVDATSEDTAGMPATGAAGEQATAVSAASDPTVAPAVDETPGTAQVVFDVTPAGTEVLAGDKVWCKTPCSYVVPAGGAVNVALRFAGHRVQSMTIPALQPDVVHKVTRALAVVAGSPDVSSDGSANNTADALVADQGPEADPPAKKKKRAKKKPKQKKKKFGLPGFRPSK